MKTPTVEALRAWRSGAAPWTRIIGALALAALLAACSTISLGYNRAATLAYWWINGQVELEPAQGQRLRTDLDALHRWHRERELGGYAERLREWQGLARQPVTPAQVCAQVEAVRTQLTRVGERALSPLASLAASLSDAQLAQLQREHAESNETFRKEFMTRDQGLDERVKRATRRAEMFYGDLSAAQRGLLREHLARSSFDAARVLAERERRQADTLRVARQAREGDALAVVRGAWQRFQQSPTPGWTAYSATLVREGCEWFAALHNSTTPEQRERAVVALAGYETDFITLAARD